MCFPMLDMTTQIMGRANTKSGQYPKVSVKVVLSYRNDKVPVWKNKKPSLTFMAETTAGKLVHIWRGNIMKLEKGLELKFNVELSGPGEEIKCWVACEEIVGTIQSCVLRPDLLSSSFPAPTPRPKCVAHPRMTERKASLDGADEFGGDDLNDDDMLAAVKSIEPAKCDYGSDDFEDIDDLDDSKIAIIKKVQKQGSFVPSVQMANGKWTCNHECADGKLLKNGKQCKHRCCHEGLDKPRKEKKVGGNGNSNGAASGSREMNSKAHTNQKYKVWTLCRLASTL